MFKSIKSKGLVIVFIPVLLSFAVFAGLKSLIENAKQQAKAENHSRAIVAAANRMSSAAFKGITAYHMFHTTGNIDYASEGDQYANGVKYEISQLNRLTRKDEVQHQRVVVVKQLADSAIELLQGSADVMDADFVASVVPAMQKKLWILIAKTSKLTGEITNAETERTDAMTEQAEAFRENMDRLLVASMGLNVILALVLAFYFGRSITDRLAVLIDNTAKFAHGEDLNKPVGGNDEISKLDDAFRAMAKELKEAREREREVERLKQSFIAMISHEIRSPLTAITMFLGVLKEGIYGNISESGQESATDAIAGSKRLMALVNEILDAERLESGRLSIDPRGGALMETVRVSARSVQPLADEKKIQVQIDGNDVELSFDAERLQQVLINLLSNAIKFSPTASTVSLRVTEDRPNKRVLVEVVDEGYGMPEEEMQLVFERFYKVETHRAENPHGAGLGLTISKSIVEAHGGTIGVKHANAGGDKGGTCFWFTLPL